MAMLLMNFAARVRNRRRFVDRHHELATPGCGGGGVENGIVSAGAERDPAGVQCRGPAVAPGAGQPVRLCIGEQLLAMERRSQDINIEHQRGSRDKRAAMGMTRGAFSLRPVLLAGLPNNAMAVQPARRHRKGIQELGQSRATGWRKAH
jgi:hypothetical protein